MTWQSIFANLHRSHYLAAALWLALVPAAEAQLRPSPQPETIMLTTADAVQLRATYYPSANRGGSSEAKQVTPVVMLHDFKETRAVFAPMAERLQSSGGEEGGAAFAVVTVDLRGHGESVKQTFPTGETIDLDAARLRRDDFLAMAVADMAAVRSFLVDKNDAGELNLNKLCVIGSGMGASMAANWALQDWSWPPLAVGKQGQDVKALVLVSPMWSFNGLLFQAPLRFQLLKQNVAWMLIYGAEGSKVGADVRRIEKQLQRFHPSAEEVTAAGKGSSTLQVVALSSKLQGSTLLRQGGAALEDQVVAFLSEHVARQPHQWLNRRAALPE